VLLWDNIRTMHNAVPDYGPDEHRLVRRCQAMADRVFDPEFARLAGIASGARADHCT
jgi:taurine dioxygenase